VATLVFEVCCDAEAPTVSKTSRGRVTAERLAHLQAATAKLAAALTVKDLSNALLSIAEDALKASAGVVYLTAPDGALRLQASRGAPASSTRRWQVLARDAPVPLAVAIATGAPVFLGTRADIADRYPAIANGGMPTALMQAAAALPLVHGGRVLGGFAVSFDSEREFDDDERSWLTSIAAQAAVAADRARLVDDLTKTVRLNELFVGVLAHDLRAPVAAIATAAEIIRMRAANLTGESVADPRNAKAANRIVASSERMARMIDQMLDFTRLRIGGGLPMDAKPAELASLIYQVAGEVDDGSPGVTVTVDDVGDTRGSWDADRLSQMLSNLIGNAVQHGRPADGVRVLVDGMDAKVVRVRVHNMGAIPGELLPKLFDPLAAGERRQGRTGGLGLGLFIAKEIVAAHGGQLSVRSNEADGTTFTVTLPRSLAVPPAVERPQPSLPTEAPILLPPPARPLTIDDERFRLLVDAVKDYAIFMLDPTGRVATWNVGAERIKGYAAAEIIGQHFSRFYEQHDIEAGKCERELEIAAREGRCEDEGWRLRKDGTRFWANVVITALRNPDGELVGFAKVTRDRTEHRNLEQEQLRLTRAEEAIRLRDEFLSLASHELKTPLTVLQLQLDMLTARMDASDAKLALKLRRASQSSERLGNVVESLLDVSRIATGRFALGLKQFDLVENAAVIIEALRPAAAHAGSELSLEAEHSVVGTWDPLRLEQVLTNLLSNAIKYGAGSAIRVSVQRRGDEVTLEVRDHGPGIPETHIGRLFQRFERGTASLRNYAGLGLGLYLIHEIVHAHGGSVAVENAEGGGARFRVHLPIRSALVSPSGSILRPETN
jgi:PAS domain S-box-containing protein